MTAPIVAIVAAAVGATIAWLGVRNAREVARQKASLDLIEKFESSDHYRSLYKEFSTFRRAKRFCVLNNPAAADAKARDTVLDYLNHYEIVAIGIRQNILDTKIYQEWMRGVIVRDWNAASPFIQRERWKQREDGGWDYNDRIFGNYQALACSWSNEAIRLTSRSSAPPTRPEGPGDEALPRLDPDT